MWVDHPVGQAARVGAEGLGSFLLHITLDCNSYNHIYRPLAEYDAQLAFLRLDFRPDLPRILGLDDVRVGEGASKIQCFLRVLNCN